MKYTVEITETAETLILEQARYIACEKQEPGNAQRWLEGVWDALEALELLPRRCALATENAFVPYEVRTYPIGSHSLLFTIDDASQKLTIIGFRNQRALPNPDSLPKNP